MRRDRIKKLDRHSEGYLESLNMVYNNTDGLLISYADKMHMPVNEAKANLKEIIIYYLGTNNAIRYIKKKGLHPLTKQFLDDAEYKPK